MKSTTLNKLLKHNFFIYGMIFISIIQLLNFYNSLICLGVFGLTYYIVQLSTKNQGLGLLVANIVSIFLLGCGKSGMVWGFKEGLTMDDKIDKKIQDKIKFAFKNFEQTGTSKLVYRSPKYEETKALSRELSPNLSVNTKSKQETIVDKTGHRYVKSCDPIPTAFKSFEADIKMFGEMKKNQTDPEYIEKRRKRGVSPALYSETLAKLEKKINMAGCLLSDTETNCWKCDKRFIHQK